MPGVLVGHATDLAAGTGCTVVLFEGHAIGGVDVGGGGASLRQADALRPGVRGGAVHGILLTGGSSFGHGAADGCLRFLEERGRGNAASVARVPRVPSAVLFDLAVGRRDRRPDAAMGYAACAAATGGPVEEGNVGAGTGCSVAKRLGPAGAWKGGLGTAAAPVGPWRVGAIAAVNAIGDVRDPRTGAPIAIARGEGTWARPPPPAGGEAPGTTAENTTLVVVATDAPFDRDQLCHLARMAQDGLALAIRPAHTPFDGDVVFAISVAPPDAPRADDVALAEVGDVAIGVVAEAIVRGVRAAAPLHGLPAVGEADRR